MVHQLPKLPYPIDGLAPYISQETLEYHYGKHHQTYVNNLNKLIVNTEYEELPLEEIIKKAHQNREATTIFNNAAQTWNHSFYWQCLAPNGNNEPAGELANALTAQFGSLATFKEQFSQSATTLFGSGWTWLVKNEHGDLEIMNTRNADLPLTDNKTALLTCDVWEHAYYIDVRNARPQYIENFWKLINWEFVASNFAI